MTSLECVAGHACYHQSLRQSRGCWPMARNNHVLIEIRQCLVFSIVSRIFLYYINVLVSWKPRSESIMVSFLKLSNNSCNSLQKSIQNDIEPKLHVYMTMSD